ncbi:MULTISPECIES: HD-GYP domain-containing protein [Aminobacterium]|uniref:HD-GYP domain-containing protein n=1 Tax=Aminobacterium TaxID=81466 RepID=UPI00257F1988|nr:HD-GYP domain-containing protein [Aminobacterium sp. UBA4834]
MPLIVTSDHLKPGMRLAKSVWACEGQQLLLSKGVILNNQLITRLVRRGIEACFVYLPGENAVEDDFLCSVVPEHLERQVRVDVAHIVECVAQNRSLRNSLFQNLQESVSSIISVIFEDTTAFHYGLKNISKHDEYTYEHMIGVMTVSLLIAKEGEDTGLFSFSFQDKINLGLGALFHDIGKLMLPSSLLNKKGPLNEKEWELMSKHPYDGFKIVRQFPCMNPMARAIVLNHHQYWNGEGYGREAAGGLAGETIPLLVRIVSVADTYDALVSDRPYRRAFLPIEALKIVQNESGVKFDPSLVEFLPQIIDPYPIGSVLFLSDWTLAAVTSISLGEPQAMVLATFRKEDANKVGNVFPLQKHGAHIVIGAPSLDHLAEKSAEILASPSKNDSPLRHFLSSLCTAFVEKRADLNTVPCWESLIKKGFFPSLLESLRVQGS